MGASEVSLGMYLISAHMRCAPSDVSVLDDVSVLVSVSVVTGVVVTILWSKELWSKKGNETMLTGKTMNITVTSEHDEEDLQVAYITCPDAAACSRAS